MTTSEKVQEQVLVGAWSVFTSKIDEHAQQAFDEAIHEIVGVHYTPVAVSQQLVAGMNYRFFCNTQQVTQHPLNGAAIVSIYRPLKGKAHITSIIPIHL